MVSDSLFETNCFSLCSFILFIFHSFLFLILLKRGKQFRKVSAWFVFRNMMKSIWKSVSWQTIWRQVFHKMDSSIRLRKNGKMISQKYFLSFPYQKKAMIFSFMKYALCFVCFAKIWRCCFFSPCSIFRGYDFMLLPSSFMLRELFFITKSCAHA